LETPQVIVISQEMASRYFAGENPIGKKIDAGWTRDDHRLGGEIVGVVGDVKQFGLGAETAPAYYAAADQWPIDELTFVIKSGVSASALRTPISNAIRTLDRDMPMFDYRALDEIIASSLAEPRFYMLLLGSFATLALVLAAVGIYGVIAYAVTQRSREIGVRMALGATSSRVLRMVVLEGLSLTVGGVVLGTVGAFALTRVMQSLLFGVTPTDPLTFATVTGVLALVAVAACIIPARRASRVDPQLALRGDG
jgi:putative ABC transport system permease protein